MKRLLGFVAILFVVGVITRAATTPGVFFCPHDKVAASLDKSAPLVTAPDFLVQGSHRTANGQPELHDK